MHRITVVILLAVDGQGIAFEVPVDPDAAPTARTAQVLPVGQLDGGTVCQRHDRVDPVGMVAVVAVPVIGHHQGQLPRLHARQVHIRILGIPRGQVRNRTAAVEGILGIDKLRTARIEQSHELVAVGRVVRRPNNMVIPFGQLPVVGRIMVHVKHVAVGQQRIGSLVVLRQVASEHQRRLEYRPKVHHRVLLVACEVGPPLLSALATDADLAQRQHVRIRPRARCDVRRPLGTDLELVVQLTPVVPEVVHRTPHVRVRLHVIHFLQRRFARRDAQHDGAAAMVYGFAYHLYLRRMVRTGEVVYLHKVHTPFGIQFKARVVVLLCAGLAVVHLVIVAQPRAGGIVAGYHVAGDAVGAFHGQFLLCRNFGQSPHQMDAELQSLAVHIVGQGAETHPVGSRRETVERRGVTPPFVVHVDGIGLVVPSRLVVLHKPTDIHHHVFPTVNGQLLCHVIGIGLHFVLHYGGAVTIPRVPTHRRGQRPLLERKFATGLGTGSHSQHAGHGPYEHSFHVC